MARLSNSFISLNILVLATKEDSLFTVVAAFKAVLAIAFSGVLSKYPATSPKALLTFGKSSKVFPFKISLFFPKPSNINSPVSKPK